MFITEYINSDIPSSLNLYTYCWNNPVMYVDSKGHFPMFAVAAIVAFEVGYSVGSCIEKQEKIDTSSTATVDEKFSNITGPSKEPYENESSLKISINLENTPLIDDESIRKYTDSIADHSEDNMDFIADGYSIDRAQLFGEIKFHVLAWQYSWVFSIGASLIDEHANPANINIYQDGRVEDPRPTVNLASDWLSGGYYE